MTGRELGGRVPAHILVGHCEYGPQGADAGPVLIAIPHAGREYPAEIVSRARVGLAGLRQLEDRHVDRLAQQAVAAGHGAIVARRGRAVIDLNRHEAEIDSQGVANIPHGTALRSSAKVRGGLGLVPHRYQHLGELWRQRIDYAELGERMATLHAPYHERIGGWLHSAAARHGGALLIDLHSMPPLRPRAGAAAVQLVISDRFGQSADPAVTALALDLAGQHNLTAALNDPYSGGYTLERHGRAGRNIHALQIEFDRSLYLDKAMDEPGPGVERCARFVAELADRVACHLAERPSLAAE